MIEAIGQDKKVEFDGLDNPPSRVPRETAQAQADAKGKVVEGAHGQNVRPAAAPIRTGDEAVGSVLDVLA